ncbi:MAG TPA: alpha/beta hydrolase [Solirubrobacteraceae bacterium]|nr:alpha/beta hydrolase [Solirubrobacteraceae bacterium]
MIHPGEDRPSRRPFEQGRFEDLPQRPRRPHRYYDADTDDVVVASAPFGRVSTRVVSDGPRDAPPLLLVHGLMMSSYSWRYLFELLGERYRLVAPDLPGAGRSDAVPDRAHTPRALATFVGELQETLGIAGCPAVGNSLGGYLCMRRALAAPASFARLAVIHAPAFPDARSVALHAALKVPGVADALARYVRHDPLRWAHRNVHYYDETLKSLEEAREYGASLASAAGARAFTRWLADSLDPRAFLAFTRELKRRRDAGRPWPAPLLLVYAREDPLIAPAVGTRLHALVPDAPIEWIERSSHFVQVDTPERLAAMLADFLGG